MKSTSQPRRILRVSRDLHWKAKAMAAAEAKTLEALADEILTDALEARRHRPADDLLRVTLSKPVPSQNRA